MCRVQFPLRWLLPGVMISYDQKQGDEFEKHSLHHASFLGWGFHAKPVFFFNIFSGSPPVDALIIGLY